MYTANRECLLINIVICACKPVVKVKHFSATTRVSMASSLSTVSDRAFPIASARLWKSRLLHITTAPSLSNFCSLKSHLFSLFLPQLLIIFLLFSARMVTCHFWHYNRFYIYIFAVPSSGPSSTSNPSRLIVDQMNDEPDDRSASLTCRLTGRLLVRPWERRSGGWQGGSLACNIRSGFPRLLESPGFFFFKIPGPGKSWNITLVLESPGNWSLRSSKALEKLLPPDVLFQG